MYLLHIWYLGYYCTIKIKKRDVCLCSGGRGGGEVKEVKSCQEKKMAQLTPHLCVFSDLSAQKEEKGGRKVVPPRPPTKVPFTRSDLWSISLDVMLSLIIELRVYSLQPKCEFLFLSKLLNWRFVWPLQSAVAFTNWDLLRRRCPLWLHKGLSFQKKKKNLGVLANAFRSWRGKKLQKGFFAIKERHFTRDLF